MSRKVSMCRSGRTRRWTGACGSISRIATKPSRRGDVVAARGRACRRGNRSRGAQDPLLRDGRRRGRARARRQAPRRRATASSRRRSRGPGDRRARVLGAELRVPAARDTRRATAARRRAPRSFFSCGGTGSSAAVTVPGRGEYGKTCTFVRPGVRDRAERLLEARPSSAGKPTITSLVRLNSPRAARAGAGRSRPSSAVPCRARRRRHPTGAAHAGAARPSASRAARRSSASLTWLISIEREPQACEARVSLPPRARAAPGRSRRRGRGSSRG